MLRARAGRKRQALSGFRENFISLKDRHLRQRLGKTPPFLCAQHRPLQVRVEGWINCAPAEQAMAKNATPAGLEIVSYEIKTT